MRLETPANPLVNRTCLRQAGYQQRYAAMEAALAAHTAMTYSVLDAFVHRNAALHPARLRLPV